MKAELNLNSTWADLPGQAKAIVRTKHAPLALFQHRNPQTFSKDKAILQQERVMQEPRLEDEVERLRRRSHEIASRRRAPTPAAKGRGDREDEQDG
jgi:hypothetical protein